MLHRDGEKCGSFGGWVVLKWGWKSVREVYEEVA